MRRCKIVFCFASVCLLSVNTFVRSTASQAEQEKAGEALIGDWSVFLPEDSGKKLAVEHCFNCHDLARVVSLRGAREFWSDLVWNMVAMGADIPPDETDSLIQYFSVYLGADRQRLKVPINLNAASVEELRLLSPLADHAEKIVQMREAVIRFEKVEDLMAIEGMTLEAVEKVNPFLSAN